MSFTRFHDDPARIQKQLEIDTYLGRYQLDVPGPGEHVPFLEDPNIRLQRWGANLRKNTTQLESELIGLTRPLNHDLFLVNNYQLSGTTDIGATPYYNTTPCFIEESRATHPAWMYRNVDVQRWEFPWINPLAGMEKPFHENIQTRILEKDYYTKNIGSIVK
jgi:hypothetical protein